MTDIIYTPPSTLREFIKDYKPGELFYDWVIGPVGSGKTTAIFMKLVTMAQLQKPGPDGIKRTRAVIVRNTLPQ
jgi:ABC-type ATPase involved in cell division